MPVNKIIFTDTVEYTEVIEGFNTASISADGATTLSAQATIDVTTPAAPTFDSGKLAVLVNQGITYTADARGTAGNSITVAFVNPGTPSAALDVPVVVGTAIVVNLATDAGVAASKIIQDLTYTADDVGAAGDDITLTYVNPGTASATIDVSVVGTDINVDLATDAGVAASKIIQDLTYTADAIGTAGNSITVAYLDPGGNDQALSVGVIASAITVNLATGPAGAITSTADEIKAAVDAFGAAAALVNVVVSGTGTDVAVAAAAVNLENGAAPALTSTAAQIKTAIEAFGAAAALVDITISGVGGNVQTAQAETPLESGVNPAITSTANDIVTALGLVASVTALVDITGGGAGVVTALAATALATGADPEVNTTTNAISIPTHGLTTGMLGRLTSTGTLPAGLSLATDYFVIVVDASTIKLATTLANAQAGTAVDITDQGSNGAVNTLTFTTMSGTVIMQKSNDNTNWLNIGSAEAFSADEVVIFEDEPPSCLYYRLVFAMTAGRFDADVIWVTRGPN